jgi:hypothetical protein
MCTRRECGRRRDTFCIRCARPQPGRPEPDRIRGGLLDVQRLEQPVRPAQRDRDRVVAMPSSPRARLGDDVPNVGSDPARRTVAGVVKLGAALRVPEQAAVRDAASVGPHDQRVQNGPQLATGCRELVQRATGVIRIGPPLEDPMLDQPVQSIGQHRLRHVRRSFRWPPARRSWPRSSRSSCESASRCSSSAGSRTRCSWRRSRWSCAGPCVWSRR